MNQRSMMKMMAIGLSATVWSTAYAADPIPEVSAVATPAPAPAAPKPPYSLPWQLRPVTVGTVLRSDTSFAFYDDPKKTDEPGSSIASTFLASYKVTPSLAPLVRLAVIQNATPNTAATTPPDATAFVNPILGLTYAKAMGEYKFAGFGGVTIPIGQGGGDPPDAGRAAAAGSGIAARSAMDNAMFAVNYFTMIAGAGAAYVAHKLTVQAEVTVLELIRARGPDTQDEKRTNLTSGLHLGYFLTPMVSLGTELRYQRWLSDATPVQKDSRARESATFAFGPRFHFKVGDHWIRPGISYSRYLDAPFSKSNYQMVQVDIPFVF